MVVTTSPTMRLIRMNSKPRPQPDNRPVTELDQLKAENATLRRKLAQLTAQYVWTEGGSFVKIDAEIRQYGFRLESMDSAHDPKIIPLTEQPVRREVTPPVERRAGDYTAGGGY